MSYDAVIPARNEEKYLARTLESIKNQTIKPDKIIVVNDGSTDKTQEIADKYADMIVSIPNSGYSKLGSFEISKTFNKGLEKVDTKKDYVLICGADNILPSYFVEKIFEEMKRNSKLVIASGHLFGDQVYCGSFPRGTRVVRLDFWKNIGGIKYPVAYGWETYLVYKALQLGYDVKRIPGLITIAQRSPKKTKDKIAYSLGMAMRTLGYSWLNALLRSAKFFLINPRTGIKMITGYLSLSNKIKLDVSEFVNKYEKKQLVKKIYYFILKKKYIILIAEGLNKNITQSF